MQRIQTVAAMVLLTAIYAGAWATWAVTYPIAWLNQAARRVIERPF